MPTSLLITGATDGIGLATARQLAPQGHALLLHGRSADKLQATADSMRAMPGAGPVETVQADLSDLDAVDAMADQVIARQPTLDVLINNAGVFGCRNPARRPDSTCAFWSTPSRHTD